MPARIDSKTLRRSLRAGIIDGSAFSVMVGIGETYLPAFVLALGHGQIAAGLTSTLPMLAGSILQLCSPPLVRRVRSHKWWVVGAATAQALCFVPLLLAALAGNFPWWGVLALATWYWACGQATGPAWTSWMSRIIPAEVRTAYFAKRTPITQVCLFAGLIGGGMILDRTAAAGAALAGFAICFAIAGIARLVCAAFLSVQVEPEATAASESPVSMMSFLSRKGSPELRLLTYMMAVQASTQMAQAFYTPYLLDRLKLEYRQYVFILAAALLAKVVMLPVLGRIGQRLGMRKLLWIGGIAVVPIGFLWIPYPSYWYLLGVQFYAGTAFAAYELATILLLFEMIPHAERTAILTTNNMLNAAAIVGGSLLGSLMLRGAGELSWIGAESAYVVLFILSSLARLATLPLLRGVIDRPLLPSLLIFRAIAIRPSSGSIPGPIPAEGEDAPELVDKPRPAGPATTTAATTPTATTTTSTSR